MNRRWILAGASVMILLLLAATGFFLWYKNPARFPSTAKLWTNRPEFAAYAELFNASQEQYRVEIMYRREPAISVETELAAAADTADSPDLIAGPYLNNPEILHYFSSLQSLFQSKGEEPLLQESHFYRQFLQLGRGTSEEQLLLPVSFNLPTLVFHKQNRSDNDQQFSLNLDIIQEESADYNSRRDGRFVRMGFSPRWNPAMLLIKSMLFQTDFRASTGSPVPEWNHEELNRSLEYIREWIQEVNQGLEAEQIFSDSYLYDPPVKLLADERILFSYSTLRDFIHIIPENRSDLDFRWIAKDDIIPVLPDALFIGVPSTAEAKPAAHAFLLWFFSPSTQALLLDSSQFKRMRTFGITDGLSSLSSVNEEHIPRYFPSLVGHIPPANYLSFPSPLPSRWNSLQRDVIIPWLLEAASADDLSSIQPLSRQLDIWVRQRPAD
jgi:hypothetical protein